LLEPISKIFQPALRAISPERKARGKDNSKAMAFPKQRGDRVKWPQPFGIRLVAAMPLLLQEKTYLQYVFSFAPWPCGNRPRSRAEYFRDRFYTIPMLVSAISILLLLAAIYLLARPFMRGAIFFPTSTRNVEMMLGTASLHSGERIADLGSGDGRILIACARQGIRAEGYEINPILVYSSRRAIRRAGFQKLATVHWKSFWRADLAPFDAIFVYGIPYIMVGLAKKLERELRPGTKVISHVFPFPEWTPVTKHEAEKVYLYEIGPKRP
jgi:hypothetical protein